MNKHMKDYIIYSFVLQDSELTQVLSIFQVGFLYKLRIPCRIS